MLKRKQIVLILTIVLILGVAYGLSRQVYSSLQAGERLELEIEEAEKLQKKNMELKKKLVEVQTLKFIEREARDKLNFSRPNETIIIVPDSEIDKVLNAQRVVEEVKLPNWQGWLQLFWK